MSQDRPNHRNENQSQSPDRGEEQSRSLASRTGYARKKVATSNSRSTPPAAPATPRPPEPKKRPTPPAWSIAKLLKVEATHEPKTLRDRILSWRRWLPGMGGSLLFHLGLLLLLALVLIRVEVPEVMHIRSGEDSLDAELEALDFSLEQTTEEMQQSVGWSQVPSVVPGMILEQSESESDRQLPEASFASETTSATDLARPNNLPFGGGLEGRSAEQRRDLGQTRGATPASEAAVEKGLSWLAEHQRRNGAWWFDHHDGPCDGRCDHPGSSGSSTAATGLALLAFLGAGYTADSGPYQTEVRDGVYYLMSKARYGPFGADLREGTMYGHGIATLALCEAYSMTQDPAIKPVAEKAIEYIINAQHKAGGWRYVPGQPGDTTVFGWQFMALKSAQMAGIYVPSPTVHLARHYLDTVQSGQGAYYGYLSAGQEPSPTAIGLLSRMYLGWRRDHPALHQGTEYLFELGPSETDVYFNYYATQVMHHYGTQAWDSWNERMREYLVATQSRRAHEAGSWYFPDEHGDQGGRLYNTAMAIMILEVYYRYMPLYGESALDAEW